MNQFFASDIALLQGKYKAAYVTIMGNVLNSSASMEKREEILTDILNRLFTAQENNLSVESIITNDIKQYFFIPEETETEEVKPQAIEPAKKEPRPPFPIFYMASAVTVSVILYCIMNSKDLYRNQLKIYPEFIAVPLTIIVLFLIYYGIMVAKKREDNKNILIHIVLIPIYLGIVGYLIITKPIYFCTVLGNISFYLLITIMVIIWAGTIAMTMRRRWRKRNKK